MSLLRSLLPLALAALVSGCAGYSIGPIKPTFMKDVNSIAVENFRNDTLEPRIETLVATTVIKQLQQDGTYQIKRAADADAILEGTIANIERRKLRSVRGNVIATRELEWEMVIRYRLYERATGRELDAGEITGRSQFFISDDLQQDERQAVPLAAEDAAVRLASRISEGW